MPERDGRLEEEAVVAEVVDDATEAVLRVTVVVLLVEDGAVVLIDLDGVDVVLALLRLGV